jgi:preprotein translocase subunit SecD
VCSSDLFAGIKYTGPADTFEIEKDDVQSARGFPDQYKQYCVLLELTKKGVKRFFTMTEKNEGNYVSIHFGDKLLTPKMFVAEPVYTREIAIQVYDEKLMNEIIKFYEK